MLGEHTSRERAGTTSSGNVLQPGTFWSLIEKLLLRSSEEAHAHRQQDLAVSALCRGHALPRLPRQLRATKQEDAKVEGLKSNSRFVYRESLNRGNSKMIGKSSLAKESYCNDDEKSNRTAGASTQTPALQNATKAKSECFANNLDVVYVNDAKIPPSERLWRYAMKHSREKPDPNAETPRNNFLPTARSNEAIYYALKNRLDEALSEQNKKSITPKKKFAKSRKTCQKNLYNSAVKNDKKSVRVKQSNTKFGSLLQEGKEHRLNQIETSRVQGVNKTIPKILSSQSNEDPPSKHDQIESSRALYDCILKKRLSCGNQLETLNKEILYKKHNPRAIMNRETTRKYAELKNDYLNLCYQECNLRHQIAILHAEIYMMQNRGFHKIPASIKTINLDPNSAIKPDRNSCELDSQSKSNDSPNILLFPCLKAPKPLQVYSQKQLDVKSKENSLTGTKKNDNNLVQQTSPSSEQSNTPLPYIMDGFHAHRACSIYSLSPRVAPPPKRYYY